MTVAEKMVTDKWKNKPEKITEQNETAKNKRNQSHWCFGDFYLCEPFSDFYCESEQYK